jgi:hypothetical protein
VGGALVIRTVRTIATGERSQAVRIIEDVTLDVVKLDHFPVELLTAPEGFRRVAHSLESAVSFEEAESARAAAAGTAPRKVVRP